MGGIRRLRPTRTTLNHVSLANDAPGIDAPFQDASDVNALQETGSAVIDGGSAPTGEVPINSWSRSAVSDGGSIPGIEGQSDPKGNYTNNTETTFILTAGDTIIPAMACIPSNESVSYTLLTLRTKA